MYILIIRVSAIGDVIHTFPAIALLKSLFPSANISWVAQKKTASLLTKQSFLKKLWILPNKFLHLKNIAETYKIVKEIRKTKWDAILDFQGIEKTSLLLPWLRGKKFGFDSTHARKWFSTFFTHHQCTPNYTNIIQKNLALASYVAQQLLGDNYIKSPALHKLHRSITLEIPKEAQNKVSDFLHNSHDTTAPLIALSPNTTWESKRWPTEYWKQLLDLLCKKNIPTILIGKKFGHQADSMAEYITANQLPVLVAPPWNLITTAHLLKKAYLLVAPDTGILHLGDFLGINTIGIFGPTLASKHGPFLCQNNRKNNIQVACSHRYKKEHGINDCMEQLIPKQLFEKIATST